MRTQPKLHITTRDIKTVKGGKSMTINITRIGTQPSKAGQMLTLSDLRKVK
jgi:hypothetical protein